MDSKTKLQEALQQAKPTLVEFYSASCATCQKSLAVLDELRAKMAGRANVIAIDADQEPELAKEYKANHFPAYMVFVDGEKYWHDNGAKPLSELEDMLNRVI